MERAEQSLPAESALLVEAFRDGPGPGEESRTRFDWASSEGFTVEEGRRQIGEYIGTWGLPPHWLHSLQFLRSTGDQHRALHHYRARFSAPTPSRPVPGTASVYFALAVPGGEGPVEVRFVVEAGRLVHTPGGGTFFRERWLTDIIELKASLYRSYEAKATSPENE